MAERHYIYVIRNETESGKAVKSPISGGGAAQDKSSGSPASTAQQREKKAWGVIKGATIYAAGKSIANTEISQSISLMEIRTGNTAYAQKLQFAQQSMNQGLSVLETVVSGAVLGGGVGALVGLAVGTAMQGLNIYNKEQLIQARQAVENQQIQRNFIRAGNHFSRSDYQ